MLSSRKELSACNTHGVKEFSRMQNVQKQLGTNSVFFYVPSSALLLPAASKAVCDLKGRIEEKP